jgi:hypothetical protein
MDTAVGDPHGSFLFVTSGFAQAGQALAAPDVSKLIIQEGSYTRKGHNLAFCRRWRG